MFETQLDAKTSKWMVPFITIWTGQAVSLLGSQVVQFALIWWLTITSGSATVLAISAIVGILPQVILGPWVGVLVDRWNRRTIMIIADSAAALVSVLLAGLFALRVAQIWHVYLALFLRSIAASFHGLAMSVSTSLMVPKKHLSRVQGANQVLNGGLNILSAPLGALLLDVFLLQNIILIDMGTALLAVVPLLFLSIPQPTRQISIDENGKQASIWTDMQAGLRYIWGWPALMAILIMSAVVDFLLNPAFYLLPLLVKDYFHGGAPQLALIQSTSGVGMVTGGLILSIWGGYRRRIITWLFGLVGIGVGVLLIGLTPASMLWFAVVAMFIAGMMMPICNGPIYAMLQTIVPPGMQGRVFTLMGSISAAIAPLGLAIAGPIADVVGVRPWFWAGGTAAILMALIGALSPAIMQIEDRLERAGDRQGTETST